MTHNVSIPRHLYVQVSQSFLHDFQGEEHEGHIAGVLHGISSTPSRSLGFHVLLENGARWSDLPLHALLSRPDGTHLPLEEISIFDAFGYDLTVTEYGYLRDFEVLCRLRSGQEMLGVYVLSLDWTNNGWSDTPEQHKELHLIALDCGAFALLPNYHCRFRDPSFVDPTLPMPKYRTQTRTWHSEHGFHMKGQSIVEDAH